MKVQITLDLDEDQRVAVGLMETGQFVPASRSVVREYVTSMAMATIESGAQLVKDRQREVANEVRSLVGKPTVAEF